MVDEFDNEYFRLQDEAEECRASRDDSLKPFSRARAAAAILCLAGDDPFATAAEAIYEAAATLDEPDRILKRVESALRE